MRQRCPGGGTARLLVGSLMLGGEFTIADYPVWNKIPTVLGNLVGGLTFTGLALYATHGRTGPRRRTAGAGTTICESRPEHTRELV